MKKLFLMLMMIAMPLGACDWCEAKAAQRAKIEYSLEQINLYADWIDKRPEYAQYLTELIKLEVNAIRIQLNPFVIGFGEEW